MINEKFKAKKFWQSKTIRSVGSNFIIVIFLLVSKYVETGKIDLITDGFLAAFAVLNGAATVSGRLGANGTFISTPKGLPGLNPDQAESAANELNEVLALGVTRQEIDNLREKAKQAQTLAEQIEQLQSQDTKIEIFSAEPPAVLYPPEFNPSYPPSNQDYEPYSEQ